MQLTAQQSNALQAVESWLKTDEPIFRLFGYAGCGKTTIAKFVQQMVGTCAYATFTGKAAAVLASKGCTPVSTLHSLLYRVHENEVTGELSFVLNYESPLVALDLLIVDEVSMVDVPLGEDVMRLAKKVLVLGDPGQLPPLEGEGYFTEQMPDVLLTEIHRQAADSPIIKLATLARQKLPIPLGKYGESEVLRRKKLDEQELAQVSQVIVGTNATRHWVNQRVRGFHGRVNAVPVPGDRLLCLRNDNKRGLFNGQQWHVLEAEFLGADVRMRIQADEDENFKERILTPIEYFEGLEQNLSRYVRKNADEFCYSYGITCHKSQGSSYNTGIVLDQSSVFREASANWLYTALTRFSQSVKLVV